VTEANLQAMWSHPGLLEPVMAGQNNGIKTGDHKRSKPRTLRFMIVVTTVERM
jgi:hypothetical protein